MAFTTVYSACEASDRGQPIIQRRDTNAWMRGLCLLVIYGLMALAILVPRAALASPVRTAQSSIFSNDTGVFEELKNCKGVTADEALQTARSTHIDANFKDSTGANVTDIVEDKANGSGIHRALVTEVKTYNYWIFGRYVTFVLAYSNPDELALYEQKAADEAAREQASKDLDSCVGKTADEAYDLAQLADCKAKFLDTADVDVTSIVADPENGSDVHKALVVEVTDRHKFLFFKESVTFKLDFEEPVSKKKRDEKQSQEESALQAQEALNSCEGKTAQEVKKCAEVLGYEVTYYDRFSVDVTKAVVNGSDDSEVANAVVTKAEIKEPSLLSPGTVSVVLDYVDPDAEFGRKEAQLRVDNRDQILQSVGKSAGQTQILVESSGYALEILDKYDTNVTNVVRNAPKGSPIRRAKVVDVSIDDDKDLHLVTLNIDFADLSSVREIAKKDGLSAETTVTDVKVKITDESPASSVPTFLIVVKGTITNNDAWAVSADDLPALGVRGAAFDDSAKMELANGAKSLAAGESCGFVYRYRLEYENQQMALLTKLEGAQVHNQKRLLYKVTWWLNQTKNKHDANLTTHRR